MTRKTQFLLAAAATLVSVAAFAAFWFSRGNDAPDTAQAPTPPAAAPNDGPPDPRLSEVRQAYKEKLAEGAPPGMIELMQGPDKGQARPGELPPLPPLPDPFVVPAGHHSDGTSGDLPPLPPPDSAPRPKTPASQEAPPPGLPPLPPLPEVKPQKPQR